MILCANANIQILKNYISYEIEYNSYVYSSNIYILFNVCTSNIYFNRKS
jgi:hypothetical protein